MEFYKFKNELIRKIKNSLKSIANINKKRIPLILLYHRVAELNQDTYQLNVSPKNFENHIKQISSSYEVISLKELVTRIILKKDYSNSVVITFDDGYSDNLKNAAPVLVKYNVPCTFFIISNYIGQEKEFWWDELERIFLCSGILPDNLLISFDNFEYKYNLKTVPLKEYDISKYSLWNVYQKEIPTARHKVLLDLIKVFRELNETQRNKFREHLLEWAGLKSTSRKSHEILTNSELIQLSNYKGFSIGSHTMNHPVLANLKNYEQFDEINNSKFELEKLLNSQIEFFSYPHGSLADYSKESVRFVKESGYLAACSVGNNKEYTSHSIYELPRFTVTNISGFKLESSIADYLKS